MLREMMMPADVNIGGKLIGENQPAFIIAEIGVNHNGDMELAKRMVQSAARCGADCVKFQTFKAERVVTGNAPKAAYQLKTTAPEESQEMMLKGLEFPESAYEEIMRCCRDEGVVFISTPYNVEDVAFLESVGVPGYKLASMHAAEPWFANYTARTGKPIILSTGMATLGEVDTAIRAIHESGNRDLVLLQCTTNYPSALQDTNLRAMQTMAAAFGCHVGYSDHTEGDIACITSIGMGAKVIEKHFTTDKALPGPDQSTSDNPEQFARLVKSIRSAELAMGSPVKQPCKVEVVNSVGMRRSIVAKTDIAKGALISEGMLTFKRPSGGLAPVFFPLLLGKRSNCDLSADTVIRWSHLSDA